MRDCFGVEVKDDVAKDCIQWLQDPAGKPFWDYLERECQCHHDGVVNALTDNPIRDILVGHRAVGAEQALLSVKTAVANELPQL